MADILEKITRYKLDEDRGAPRRRRRCTCWRSSPAARRACAPSPARSRAKLAAGQPALIAEIKKASPSKGLIRADFDPPALAKAYEAGGAACLSVLTDAPVVPGRAGVPHRGARGDRACPRCARTSCSTPIRWPRRAPGAPTAFSSSWPRSTTRPRTTSRRAASDWGMDAIVEVHDEAELDRALALDCRLIGINNRNLKTFETTLATTERLAPRVPKDRIVIGESGIFTPADIARLEQVGVATFLVGESLMRQADVTAATRALLARAAARRHERDSSPISTRRARRAWSTSRTRPPPPATAIAEGFVAMAPETLALRRARRHAKKGDVLATARIAGIMAAKRTARADPALPSAAISPRSTVELAPTPQPPGIRVDGRGARPRARPASRWRR